MYKGQNRDKINFLECTYKTLVSKNRNDIISIYGSDESLMSSSKLHSSYSHYTFCFFRFSCSPIYLNFIQFILNKSSERLKEVLEPEELDQNNEQFQQELSACQHFFDYTKMEKGRHRMFNFMLS